MCKTQDDAQTALSSSVHGNVSCGLLCFSMLCCSSSVESNMAMSIHTIMFTSILCRPASGTAFSPPEVAVLLFDHQHFLLGFAKWWRCALVLNVLNQSTPCHSRDFCRPKRKCPWSQRPSPVSRRAQCSDLWWQKWWDGKMGAGTNFPRKCWLRIMYVMNKP